MAKPKFELTSDLVKIEPEPTKVEYIPPPPVGVTIQEPPKPVIERDNISLKIVSSLKKELQIWCIHNNTNMTDVLEISIREFLDRNS
jgi:hypothetical protein